MTVYMPPISRKKKVDDRYKPDSFRVISEAAAESHPKYMPEPYRASFQPPTPDERLFPDIDCRRTRVLPKPISDFRQNNPHPKQCSFIDTNVRLLNEPICTVFTKETHPDQNRWWPARANKGTLEKGEHTQDTIYRNDYLYTKNLAPQPNFRHSANPQTEPARGIAPVNFMKEKDGKQGFYKEGMSYEHMYNSRTDPNYPIRSKRHGSFVYTKMDPEASKKFVEYHTNLDNEDVRHFMEDMLQAESMKTQSASKHTSPRHSSKKQFAPLSAPISRPPQKSDQDIPRPEMLPTCASPVEFYDPTGRIPQ